MKGETRKPGRIIYFDILNIVACLAVVYMHCLFTGISDKTGHTSIYLQSSIVGNILTFAVPVFLALSGANLMDYRKKYSTGMFFKKRLLKVAVPFVLWSVIYFIFFNKGFNPLQFGKGFLAGNIQAVFWFFPLIIFIYLLMPALSLLAERVSVLRYILWVFIIMRATMPFLFDCAGLEVPNIFSYFAGLDGWLTYVFLGYYLKVTDIKKRNRILIYAAGVLGALFKAFTVVVSLRDVRLMDIAGNITYIPTLAIVAALFVAMKYVNWGGVFKAEKSKKFIGKLSSMSYGVYIMHMFLIEIEKNLIGLNLWSVFYRFIFPIFVYSGCVLLTFLIKKIPVIGKILLP